MAVVLAVLAATLLGSASAHAAEQNAYAAGMNYLTPVVNIGQGDSLTFHNYDTVAQHDLVGHDGTWGSALVGAGQSAPVEGVESLSQGTYDFHCTLHNWMQGKLNVSAGGGGGAPTAPGAGNTSNPGNSSTAPDPRDVYATASKGFEGGDWPMYGHDLSNTRNGGEGGPTPAEAIDLGAAWSFFSNDGDFTGTPVVADGKVIAGSRGGTVFAVDAVSGRPVWQTDVIDEAAERDKTSMNASATVHRGRVYIPVVEIGRPRLVSLDLDTGKLLWDREVGVQDKMDTYGSPTAYGKRIYLGTSGYFGELGSDTKARGSVVALNWKTGKMKWHTYTVPEGHDGGAVWSTPAFDPATKKLYVGTGNAYNEPAADTTDSMLQLDAKTGKITEHFQGTAGDAWNGPEDTLAGNPDADFGASANLIELPDGRKAVGQGKKDGMYWMLDRETMEPIWSAMVGPGSFSGGVVGSTAFDGNRIYGPDTVGGESWALGLDGRLNWVSADGGPLHFNATSTANGVVYTTDMSGHLIAREAMTGIVLAKIPLGSPSWAGVSIAGKSVFTATGTQGETGWLVAYRPRTGNEPNEGQEHWDDEPPPDEADTNRPRTKKKKARRSKRCKTRKGGARRSRAHAAGGDGHTHSEPKRKRGGKGKKCRKKKSRERDSRSESDPYMQHEHEDEAGGHHDAPDRGGGPLKAIRGRGDRYMPKPVGTREKLTLYYGPYTVPPGWDANRIDLELPLRNGMLESVDPSMRRTVDMSEPTHREAHIHHAHWFRTDPGNTEDNYFAGTHEWIFGNGDEETKGDFRPRSAADPNGPVYGQYIKGYEPSPVIYMLHNKTATPLTMYIILDVTFVHGSPEQLEQVTGREHRDVRGILFGRTYDVPREPNGDGLFAYTDTGKNIEFVSKIDGTIVGMGGHLHPGGRSVIVENYGSEESPCQKTSRWGGGTLLLKSDARFVNAKDSEDFQMEVTHPGFRAPVRKGDRIRINGVYANRDHAWYDVMTHLGIYVDPEQQPTEGCAPRLVNDVRWKPTKGVMNRPWDHHEGADICGEQWGRPPCDKPDTEAEPPEVNTDTVHIANFAYIPGDRSASSGLTGGIPTINQGEQLTFVNEDQTAEIRHTVTTCAWPCNGRYVANYPLPDGAWDSGTMGYDVIDGGSPNPTSQTPKDLRPGKYAYFCRIHPWMRGAFKVKE